MGQDFKKYTYRVRWSAEDEEYLATVAEFPSLSWLAEEQSEAFEGIVGLVRAVVDDMEANGEQIPVPYSERSYSGSIRLRIPPEQHRELAIRAAEEGVSLNRLLSSLVSRPATARTESAEGWGASKHGARITAFTASARSMSRDSLRLVSSKENIVSTTSATESFSSKSSHTEWAEEV